ncbi:MAG: ABC transporter permease subunit [Caldilineaceae bacterium]
MLLILALGIRNGYRPFLIGLSVVGWGEVMQYVRGQVIAMRPRAFVESAYATGAGTSRIIVRHLIPNLAPALISLAALEMGAVLMLLGELGFIGIFIGGGAFAELVVDGQRYHYSDVPEWGALLSNVRLYARTYPWTALYPALAFFVAILGFNLLGEGLHRRVDAGGMRFNRLANRYVFLGVAVVIWLGVWVSANSGSAAFLRTQARQFGAARAGDHRRTGRLHSTGALGHAGPDRGRPAHRRRVRRAGSTAGRQRELLPGTPPRVRATGRSARAGPGRRRPTARLPAGLRGVRRSLSH